ncbi:M28 family peptidase [Mongoliitalea daihaiensis]|uniref:M28 family peptidase n=1 Tax=Mongoliitalea daihaiensis TaxID=2782006 RepID=UPI001F2D12EA|nr:M28 family peptidase [Mongoliitalea daihaiensis]UJP65579.1 M28 family peptidase [Mongoliitalea daihaiensis]
MKKRFWLVGAMAYMLSFSISAQDATALKYGATITAADLEKHLRFIASDELAGRDTGTEGQKMAASYIKDHFEKWGLAGPVDGGYYQVFNLVSNSYPGVSLQVGKNKMQQNKDFIFVGDADMKKSQKAAIVFVGDGSKESLAKVDVKGKLAAVWAIGARTQNIVKDAMEAGAIGVIVTTMEDQTAFDRLAARYAAMTGGRLGFERPTVQEPAFMVSGTQMAAIFGATVDQVKAALGNPASVAPAQATFQVKKQTTTVPTENVLGYLEGTDKKEEVLVLSAHYDHVSPGADGRIIPGADDNGSGTVAVMEIAEAFALAAKDGIKPRRSVLFIALTAEEKGLLGSQYYVENPIFPLENTVNNLNIDMLGRIDNVYKDAEDTNYLYAIGSEMLSSHLKKILDYNNITYTGLNLDYRYDDPADPNRFYFRSDHYNFAKYNIPSIFFFSGLHNDYHTPEDTIDKIEFPLMTTRAQLIFHLAWDLANREKRNPVDGSNNRGDR